MRRIVKEDFVEINVGDNQLNNELIQTYRKQINKFTSTEDAADMN